MTARSRNLWLLLAVLVAIVWTFLPMYWTVKWAFMSKTELSRFPPVLYPHEPTLAAFFNIFGYDYTAADGTHYKASGQASQVILGLRNSFLVAIIVAAITTIVVVPLAYIFGRMEFRFKTVLLTAILLSVSLPPVSTLIPFYTLYVQLDLTGTLVGLVIVTLTITIPIVAWMLIGFFRNLPPIELLARIDGFFAPLRADAHHRADGAQRHPGCGRDRLPVLLERIRVRANPGHRHQGRDTAGCDDGLSLPGAGARAARR